MSESIWQHESCAPGRKYMLGSDPYIKYDDEEAIISKIVEGLREFIHAEPAVRLTVDTDISSPERAILAIPFESDQEIILFNFARIIYQSLMGYYISAAPRTTHFGISNLVLEGNVNSLLRREMEKLISQFHSRSDMAGRLLQNVGLVGKFPVPKPGNVFLSETLKKGLDIHVGYRIFATGNDVNCTRIFLPLQTGYEIIDHIYYNVERMIHHSFVTYDEIGDNYLKITDTLVFRELSEILKRSRTKEITRNKILNNLQLNVIVKREKEEGQKLIMGDRLYDMLNRIQDIKLKEATDHSRDLYVSCMTGTADLVQKNLQFLHPQSDIEAIESTGELTGQESGFGTGTSPESSPFSTRSFRRQGSVTSKGRPPRKRFLKVKLTEEELNIGKVQVPSPDEESRRVPSPRISRVSIKPQNAGTPSRR